MTGPLIGVCGRKRHGKDSVGRILAENYGILRLSFADQIKRFCMQTMGLTYDQVYGDLKEVVDPGWGKTPREIMQQVGSSARVIHRETWTRIVFRNVNADEWEGELHSETRREFAVSSTFGAGWVVCDVRHPDEAAQVRAHGGRVWKVHRPGVDLDEFSNHESERNVDTIDPDWLIVNDGSLDDLRTLVTARLGAAPGAKLCSGCGQWHPLTAFGPSKVGRGGLNSRCRGCQRRSIRAWEEKDRLKRPNREREQHLQSTYGIGLAEYNALLGAQGGHCRLCPAIAGRKGPLVVDHDHTTGRIRGLLCDACNLALPQAEIPGWLEAVRRYLGSSSA